jgi:hypothetical protein
MSPAVGPAAAIRPCRAALAGLLASAFVLVVAAGVRGQDTSSGEKKKGPEPGQVEVRFADSSILKLKLKDDRLPVTTRYGKLLIPLADIRKIDFATRIPADMARRIEAAIADLGSADFPKREAAGKELLALREKAYPSLLEAAKSKDPEVARRAEDLVRRLRESVPEEMLVFRKQDVIYTEDAHFSGKIETEVLKAGTLAFGEVELKLVNLRNLRNLAVAEPEEVVAAEPDPGALYNYQQHVGKKFAFRVTGAINGSVWGTDMYTLDSNLATAAVHAGILKVGQTGVVKVMILGPQAVFNGSARNGVNSSPWGTYPGAYQFVK